MGYGMKGISDGSRGQTPLMVRLKTSDVIKVDKTLKYLPRCVYLRQHPQKKVRGLQNSKEEHSRT